MGSIKEDLNPDLIWRTNLMRRARILMGTIRTEVGPGMKRTASEDGASQVNDSGLNEKDEFFEDEGDSSDATGDCHDGKFQHSADTSRTTAKAHRNATGPVASGRGLRVALQEAKANRTWISWTDLATTSNRVPYATTPQRNGSRWDNTNPKMKRAGVYMIVYAGVSDASILRRNQMLTVTLLVPLLYRQDGQNLSQTVA